MNSEGKGCCLVDGIQKLLVRKNKRRDGKLVKLVIVGHSRIANESSTPLFFVLIVVVHRRVWNT